MAKVGTFYGISFVVDFHTFFPSTEQQQRHQFSCLATLIPPPPPPHPPQNECERGVGGEGPTQRNTLRWGWGSWGGHNGAPSIIRKLRSVKKGWTIGVGKGLV